MMSGKYASVTSQKGVDITPSDYGSSRSGKQEALASLKANFKISNDDQHRRSLFTHFLSNHLICMDSFWDILNMILSLPDYFLKVDLAEFVFQELDKQHAFKNVLSARNVTEIVKRIDEIEVIAFIYSRYKKISFGHAGELETLIVDKLNHPQYALYKRCHCEIVQEFCRFKQTNSTQPFFATGFNYLQVKRCIQIIHSKLFSEILLRMEFMPILKIYVDWLMIIALAVDKDDYNLVKDLCNVAIILCKKYDTFEESKLKELLVLTFNYLKYHYFPNDVLQGYKNFLVLFDLCTRTAIKRTIQIHFADLVKEMNFEIEAIIQVFINLIRLGITETNCLIVMTISEMYEENKAYEQLYEIFNCVICEYVVQKIHVERGFTDTLNLVMFYFLGLTKVYEIKPETLLKFSRSLRFMVGAATKSRDKLKLLSEFVDFLDIILEFYDQSSVSQNPAFIQLKEMVQSVRREFGIERDARYMKENLERGQVLAWRINYDDIKASNQMSSIDTLLNRYASDVKHKGLKNLGNTCYLNSAMMSLFMTSKFRDDILKLSQADLLRSVETKTDKKSGAGMAIEERPLQELYNLFGDISTTRDPSIDPSSFRESLPLRYRNSNREEDASEFFRDYLDLIEKPLKKTARQNLIDECFAGEITNKIECKKCQKPQTTIEKILDLTVNLNPKGKDPKTGKYDLKLMIRSVFDEEVFEAENKYMCETCGTYSELTIKTSKFTKMPELLIVTLNRFYFDTKDNQRSKICDPVTIHNHLNFSQILQEPSSSTNSYNLYAIIIHSGLSAEHGHYYTICKENPSDKSWRLFNDSLVLIIPDEDFDSLFEKYPNDTPYMLFYKRVERRIIN